MKIYKLIAAVLIVMMLLSSVACQSAKDAAENTGVTGSEAPVTTDQYDPAENGSSPTATDPLSAMDTDDLWSRDLILYAEPLPAGKAEGDYCVTVLPEGKYLFACDDLTATPYILDPASGGVTELSICDKYREEYTEKARNYAKRTLTEVDPAEFDGLGFFELLSMNGRYKCDYDPVPSIAYGKDNGLPMIRISAYIFFLEYNTGVLYPAMQGESGDISFSSSFGRKLVGRKYSENGYYSNVDTLELETVEVMEKLDLHSEHEDAVFRLYDFSVLSDGSEAVTVNEEYRDEQNLMVFKKKLCIIRRDGAIEYYDINNRSDSAYYTIVSGDADRLILTDYLHKEYRLIDRKTGSVYSLEIENGEIVLSSDPNKSECILVIIDLLPDGKTVLLFVSQNDTKDFALLRLDTLDFKLLEDPVGFDRMYLDFSGDHSGLFSLWGSETGMDVSAMYLLSLRDAAEPDKPLFP